MCKIGKRCAFSQTPGHVKFIRGCNKYFGNSLPASREKYEALPEAFKTGSLKVRAAEAQTSTDPLVFEAALKDSKGVFKALLSNEEAMKDPELKAKVEAKVEESSLRNAQLAENRVAKEKARLNERKQERRRATLAEKKAYKEANAPAVAAREAAEAARKAARPVLTPVEQAARNTQILADHAANKAARAANFAARKEARKAELAAEREAAAEAQAPAKAVKPKKVAKPRSLAAVSASIAKKAAAGEEIRTKAKAVPAKAKHPTQAVVEQAQAEFEGRDKTFIAAPMRTEGPNLTGEEYKPLQGTFKNKAAGEYDRSPKHKVHTGDLSVGEPLPDHLFPFGRPKAKKKVRPAASKVTVVPANQPFPGLALAAEKRRAEQAEGMAA